MALKKKRMFKMKLQATEFLLRSLDAEIRPFLRGLNRTARMARDERRISKLRDRLAAEWRGRETGKAGK